MATEYQGQMADAFTKGMQGGYGFVDKALTSSQNRNNKQREADQVAEVRGRQIRMANQIEQEQVNNTAVNAETTEAVKTAQANQKAANANTLATVTNQHIIADTDEDSADSIDNANTVIKNDPSLSKTLGMGPDDKIENIDLNIEADNKAFTKQLDKDGITPESMDLDMDNPDDKAIWEEMKGELSPVRSGVKVGGTYMNIDDLAQTTNSKGKASAKTKKGMDSNKVKQQNIIKKYQNKNYDAKLSQLQTDLKKVGINLNTANLKTMEQKSQAIEDGQKKLYDSSFSTESKEGSAADAAMYGTTSKPPETKTMIDGELVATNEAGEPIDGKGKVVEKKLPDGSKQVHTAGEVDGTTNTKTTKPDGTVETKTTVNQELGKDATAVENAPEVEQSIQQAKESSTPVDETRLRHMYALAGMTYPIPDKGAKAKQYEFLVANGLDKDTAMSWTFEPSKKGLGSGKMDALQQRRSIQLEIDGYDSVLADLDPNSQSYKDITAKKTIAEADLVRRVYSASESTEEKNIKDSSAIRSRIDSLKNVDPYSFEGASMLSLERDEQSLHADIKGPDATKLRAQETQMDNNLKTVNSVNRFLNTYGDKLKIGEMDRGFLSNSVQWAKKHFTDDMTAEQKAKTLARIEADTTIGIIITEFIKDTTGLAMTEGERKTYNNIIAGGDNADSASLLAAITSFRDSRMANNSTIAKQIYSKSPATVMRDQQYTKVNKRYQAPKDNATGGTGRGAPRGGGNTGGSSTGGKKKKISDLF